MTLNKVISASLSPNTEKDDYFLALQTLFAPRQWVKGTAIGQVENWFKKNFQARTAVSFDSGRAALLGILKSFGIGKGDEVLMQAFTCVAVPNSVIWAGARPVFVDIDESFNLDPDEVEKKITSRTRAVIVQHTFGVPAQMSQLLSLAQKYNLVVIEDCAHSLGATYEGKKVGTWGDAAFFSFGRDKVISSVWGGVAIINEQCKIKNAKLKLKQFQKELKYPSRFWIFQQLLHPLAFSLILMSYNMIIGKVILVVLQRLKLLSLPVYPEEDYGRQPRQIPAKYPNALAILLVKQLSKLEKYNKQRQQTANLYWQKLQGRSSLLVLPLRTGAIYLRYPILTGNRQVFYQKAKKSGILLGNWYHHVVDPTGVSLSHIGYQTGSCPRAEAAAAKILNLPTLIRPEQAELVTKSLL